MQLMERPLFCQDIYQVDRKNYGLKKLHL